jgi:hypothetical protein
MLRLDGSHPSHKNLPKAWNLQGLNQLEYVFAFVSGLLLVPKTILFSGSSLAQDLLRRQQEDGKSFGEADQCSPSEPIIHIASEK